MAKADLRTPTSRRAVLAGIAASPALAGPALALVAAPGAYHPDAALFAIEEKLPALFAYSEVLRPEYSRVEETVSEWRRNNPKPTWPACTNPEADGLLRRLLESFADGSNLTNDARAALIAAPTTLTDDVRAALSEQVGAMGQNLEWRVRERAAKADCHFDEIEAEWEASVDAVSDLLEEACEFRATTLAGLKCKARINAMGVEMLDSNDVADSIARDLLSFS